MVRNQEYRREGSAAGTTPEGELEIILASIEAFQIALRPAGPAENIVSLANRYTLSFYDAAYLALAISEDAPLATLDRALARAASEEGVLLRT